MEQASVFTAPALSVEGVSQRFGKTQALNNLTFQVEAGQVVGLLGRNGAGKSTLLRIVANQLPPGAGKTLLFGKGSATADALGQLCLIGDEPDFGTLKNIKQLFWVCAGLFPGWDNPYALRLVDRFELPLQKKLKGFSRGMQTALLLAVGLASGAALTVFDEPSLGLDAVMRERFYDLLLEERKKDSGRTFLLSTHLIDEVARTLDYAIMIDMGALLCQGTLEELTRLYLSVSGARPAVEQATQGQEVLKEEEVAGSLVRHLRAASQEAAAAILADDTVQSATMSLQRLFVFLTEEKEAARHDSAAQSPSL